MIKEIIKEYPCLEEGDFKMSSQEEDAKLILGKKGIDKLQAHLRIKVAIQEQSLRPYNYISKKGQHEAAVAASVVVTGSWSGASEPDRWEIGTAHHKNSNYPFEGEMAYKRARARLIMSMAGISTDDVISEVEHYDKLKFNSNMEQLSKQLSTPMDEQDIQRAAEQKARIKSKLDQSDQERTVKNNKGSNDESLVK